MIIDRGGNALRLVPASRGGAGLASVRGVWRDQVRIADDFDEIPGDVARALGVPSRASESA